MRAVEVEGLTRVFTTTKRRGGLSGAFKTLFRPERLEVRAVESVSFGLEEGELVGFLGPNGAGKTTILFANLARQPAEVFPPALHFVLTYCLPMLVIVNFPVKAYLNRLPPVSGLWALAATIALLAFSQVFFTFALRRYRSASS